jgi:2-iminobutanoate/2-iminopropanoate deaminase
MIDFRPRPGKGQAVKEKTVVGALPVGGTEPLISTAVVWGDLLFLSGRAPIDTSTMEVVSDDFEVQARDVLRQIGEALRDAGSAFEHVLRVQCYLLRAEDFDAWNRIWAETFPAPRPVRTTITTGFTVPGMLIEIEVTAGIPS